jgi:hypothetical protein
MVAIGVAGLARFGFTDQPIELTHREQKKMAIKVINSTENSI